MYKSIDTLPIYNWHQINETGNLVYLYIQEEYEEEIFDNEDLMLLWDSIYNEYIEVFGLSDKYLEYMNKKISISKLQADQVITGNRTLNTLMRAKERELADLTADFFKGTYLDTQVAIERYMGFQLDPKKVSVNKFYTYLNNMEKNG